MKIYYLGHSSFMLVTKGGTRIVCDPFSPEIGYAMPSVTADLVTVSHHHYDHDAADLVGGDFSVIEGACEQTFRDVQITSYKCWHDEYKGARRGENYAFKFEADGVSVCHLGDIGEPQNEQLCAWLKGVDVLLIPVGGNYTIDAKTAAEYIKNIAPNIAVPMHYAIEGGKIDIDGVQRFLDITGAKAVYVDELEATAGTLIDETKIICMERI